MAADDELVVPPRPIQAPPPPAPSPPAPAAAAAAEAPETRAKRVSRRDTPFQGFLPAGATSPLYEEGTSTMGGGAPAAVEEAEEKKEEKVE